MGKQIGINDYFNLARQRGFQWIGEVLPETTKIKTLWQCSENHQWQAVYQDIKKGHGCPECYKNNKRTPTSEYHKLAQKRGFKWIGPEWPRSVDTPSLWECSQGHQWQARFGDIKKGVGCPYCAKVAPKTAKDYRQIAGQAGIKWLGPLPDNIRKKTKWQCEKGHTWETTYDIIAGNHGCPKCAAQRRARPRRKKPEDYHKIARKNSIEWLGPEVKNTQAKTAWRCSQGHQWEAHYNSIQQKRGCPYCQNRIPKTIEDYKNLARQMSIEWVGKKHPETVIHKTIWKCPVGHTWQAHYNSIQQGSKCPVCRRSNGETEIASILDKLGILYERQKTFDTCRGKRRPLPFDFMVIFPSHIGLIEYDGKQHFEPVKGWGGQKTFNQVCKHDNIKTNFAASQSIPLLRIAYNENIADKLLDWLNQQLHTTNNIYLGNHSG